VVQEAVDLVYNCAIDFVVDLIDDAVDDFTDDLVHDVDDMPPFSMATPMKLKLPLNDAQLVMSAGEPSILEEDLEAEEDEDILAAATIFTARVAEEALSAVVPASPSWSLQVNVESHAEQHLNLVDVVKRLDLQMADDEDIDESSSDEYEEVYSLASDDADEQATDDELETMAYVQMAMNLAKAAVTKGCAKHVHEDDVVDLEEAKAAARGALCTALLGRRSLFEESEEAETEEVVEFLGEGPSCSNELSFNFACGILDGALGQAVDTWAEQEDAENESEAEDEEQEIEELRLQTMATLSKAIRTGELEAVFKQVTEEKELEKLKEKARNALLSSAAQQQLVRKTDELTMLREKAKETLVRAAQAGQLAPALKASSEAAELEALKMKVRNTLCQAAREGRLSPTLNEVAPKRSELDIAKDSVREALAKGLQNGQLGQLFANINEDKAKATQQEMQNRVRNAFARGVANGKLESAVTDIVKARKESIPNCLPATPAAVAPSAAVAPATPTRSRRRIIGGVVRAPAIDLDMDLPSASPTSASRSDSDTARKRHSKSGRKSLKEARTLCMDRGEDCEDLHSWTTKLSLQHPKLETFSSSRATPNLDLYTSSKASARLRAASTSALAMDLGFPSAASSHTLAPSSSPFRQASTSSAFSLEPKMHTSFSLGALPSHKMSKGGLLPVINTGKKSMESINWSLEMSKTASKWSNTGLRGSASMVF